MPCAPTSQPSSPPCDPTHATAPRRPPWRRRCGGSSAGWRSPSPSPTSPSAWPLEQVTGALSAFASGCLDALTDVDPPAARPRRPARHRQRSRGRRPHRARHGQARRRRAQLLERHRPDPALRPRRRRRSPATTSSRGISCAPRACWCSSCRRPRSTATSSAPTCGCAPIPARRRSPCRCRRPSSTTRASARTGSAPP